METTLNALERIMIFGALPKEGSFATLKTLRQLKEKIVISEEEGKEFDLQVVKHDGDKESYTWNEKGRASKPFDFTDGECKIIKDGLKDLDKKAALTENHISVCEKFLVE